jgi:hypothetical protein
MKNYIHIFLLLLFSTTFAQAQVVLGVNTNVSFATTNLQYAGTGAGFGITGLYKYKHIGIGVNLGYVNFWEKYAYTIPYNTGGESISYKSFSITNITGRFNYFILTKKIKPYLGLDIGAYIMGNTHRVVETVATTTTQNYQFSETNAGISPSVGVLWAINHRIDLQAQFAYSLFYSLGMIPNPLKRDWYSVSIGVMYRLKRKIPICGLGIEYNLQEGK